MKATVVGSGPNGLVGALRLAEAGMDVTVYEAADTIGGGCRTAELTLPGFRHDVCSSVHPLAAASTASGPLASVASQIRWLHAPLPLAHPFDDGTAAAIHSSFDETVAGLGADGQRYRNLLAPLLGSADAVLGHAMSARPLLPRHPLAAARFGAVGLRSAQSLVARWNEPGRALLAGLAAHAVEPLDRRPTAAFGIVLAMLAHRGGWPVAAGGSAAITDALAQRLRQLGGRIETGSRVASIDGFAKPVLLDVAAPAAATMISDLPARTRRRLASDRRAPGVCKVDFALSGPVPWTAPDCRRAGTLHLGGTFEEIAAAEAAAANGHHAAHPFVLAGQPTLADPSRAPAGKHILWAYAHVPNGSRRDIGDQIEAQIERFAPGFGALVLARTVQTAAELGASNANCIGGDITGGRNDLAGTLRRHPHRLTDGAYLCSASTSPGGGVHGWNGWHAAGAAL